MTAHLGVAAEASGAVSVFRSGPSDDADLLVWVKYLESRIDAVREELSSERARVDDRFAKERQRTEEALRSLREQLERQIEERHRALREANLDGIAIAAVGGAFTLVGLLLGWPTSV